MWWKNYKWYWFPGLLSIAGAIASLWTVSRKMLRAAGELLSSYLMQPWIALVFTTAFILIVIVLLQGFYSARGKRRVEHASVKIEGRRLFEYEGLYPLEIEPGTNIPSVSKNAYINALLYFLNKDYDKLAAMDLVYLREDNKLSMMDIVAPEDEHLYEKLLHKYELHAFKDNFDSESKLLFRNAERIVNDIGSTLSGMHCEILLHDVRNPLRSIIAAKNTENISKRRLHDPSTRFVVEYMKNQGRHLMGAMSNGSKVAYPKCFTKTKIVKATTTPLFDERYGLIGILCFNIDIDRINNLNAKERTEFFSRYTETIGDTPEFEKVNAPN